MKTWRTSGGTDIIRVLYGRSNVFLVTQGDYHILFDTCSRKYRKDLFSNLRKLFVSRLDALVLSHTHFDHAGNAAAIREIFGARTFVHQEEAGFLVKGENPPIAGTLPLTRLLVNTFGKRLERRLKYTPCKPDDRITGSIAKPFPGLNISLLHTPGHSPGMISMIIDDEIALVGDTLFGIFPWSAFPPFAEDPGKLIRSWKILLDTGCSWFFPSHGRPVSRELLIKCYRKRRRG
jgi:glyoxylase-like metal-dependent hydrolase (beta-lactamase superfamily II)